MQLFMEPKLTSPRRDVSAHSYHTIGERKKVKGRRHMRKDEDKAWFTEALLEESDTQCIMMFESVYEGAQCDTTMKPKVHRVPVQGQNL